MRKPTRLTSLLAASLAIAWWGCSKPDEPLSPSFATTAACNVTVTYLGPKTLAVSPNSSNNNASWHINNNGSSAVSLTGQTLSKSGAVTAVKTNIWAVFPYSLAAGSKIDADLRFDVGASGTGSVGMTVSSSCGSLVAPAHLVTIQATTATGIPYGLFGLKADSVPSGTIWTGSALTNKNLNSVLTHLAAARNKTPRISMWFNMVAGDEQVFMRPDGSFDLQAWKDTLDNHAKPLNTDGTSSFYDDFLPFIQDGTFQGHQMLDDLAAFTPDPSQAQIDSIAAHSKRRFPTLPTAVRFRATQLKAVAPACSTCPGGKKPYGVLDMGWAQYHSRHGDATAYRNAEISAAKDMQLGLVMGINIRKGMPNDLPVPTDSILKWGNIFLEPGSANSDYVCGFVMWDVAFVGLGNSVFSTLATKAKDHVKAPCKRR